jgi:hypothetical protein
MRRAVEDCRDLTRTKGYALENPWTFTGTVVEFHYQYQHRPPRRDDEVQVVGDQAGGILSVGVNSRKGLVWSHVFDRLPDPQHLPPIACVTPASFKHGPGTFVIESRMSECCLPSIVGG